MGKFLFNVVPKTKTHIPLFFQASLSTQHTSTITTQQSTYTQLL